MGVARALVAAASLLVVAVAANGAAPQSTGGLRFGPGTLVEPLRPFAPRALRADSSGRLWVTGPSGVLALSTDGGDSFRPLAPPVRGGSIDVVDAGGTQVVASADGIDVAVAGSDDGGSTWRTGGVSGGSQATRVWLAADDSTVFMAVTGPAGTDILGADRSSLAFSDAGGPGVDSTSTRCGQLVFDPVGRTLYLPCARQDGVDLVAGQVPPGRRTGLAFSVVQSASSTGPVGGPLPTVAVDAGGTAHLVWVDAAGGLRSPGRLLTAGGPRAALPVAVGGAPGSFAVAFLGTDAERDPATTPDPRSDPAGAAAVRWYGYALLVTPTGTFVQRTTSKPVAFGRICATCNADPIVGDALGAALDPVTGALRIALADASDPGHVPQGVLVRQLEGPTALGQSVSRSAPANGVVDGAGDAVPPALDVTKLELRQTSPATLQVRTTVASAAPLALPEGAASGIWLTRFQVLSRGRAGEPAYRSLYAAAISSGAAPRFVAGEVVCTDLCRAAPPRAAGGRIEGNAIVVDVNLVALSAAVRLDGDLFYNVAGFTFAGDAAGAPVRVLDSLASFDYRLDQRIGPTTGRGRRITLRGAIRGGVATVDVFENRTGRVSFRDSRARVVFRSTRIMRVTVRGRTATITGTGLNGTRRASFVATVVDRGAGRLDSFALRLSTGYRRSGRLTSGNATIRGTG